MSPLRVQEVSPVHGTIHPTDNCSLSQAPARPPMKLALPCQSRSPMSLPQVLSNPNDASFHARVSGLFCTLPRLATTLPRVLYAYVLASQPLTLLSGGSNETGMSFNPTYPALLPFTVGIIQDAFFDYFCIQYRDSSYPADATEPVRLDLCFDGHAFRRLHRSVPKPRG